MGLPSRRAAASGVNSPYHKPSGNPKVKRGNEKMEHTHRDRFTTGEFAALCGVTRHTLFHYDALGIFSPAVRGENGYRYYTAAQLDVFQVISVLRELDLSLGEIRAYLDRRSPEALAELLEREDARLGEKIARLWKLRALVRGRAALIRRAAGTDLRAVTVEELPRRLLVLTPVPPLFSERTTAESLGRHQGYCREHNILSPYSVGAIFSRPVLEREGYAAACTHFYTQVDRPPRGVAVEIVPQGRYFTACHEGGYDTVVEAYRRLLDRAAAEGLTLGERFYEDVLLDELSAAGYEHYVLKISIQVI